MNRSGTADLPLHGGRVPRWLVERMTELGIRAIEEQRDPMADFAVGLSRIMITCRGECPGM